MSERESDFKQGLGEASMMLMDAVDDDFVKIVHTFHEHCGLMLKEMEERGLDHNHAVQLITSFAVGACLNV